MKDKEGVSAKTSGIRRVAYRSSEEYIGVEEERRGQEERTTSGEGFLQFVINYNCRGKACTMKSCMLASRAVSEKIVMKGVLVDK